MPSRLFFFCSLSMFFGTLAQEQQERATSIGSSCEGKSTFASLEEGIELLQTKAKKVSGDGETELHDAIKKIQAWRQRLHSRQHQHPWQIEKKEDIPGKDLRTPVEKKEVDSEKHFLEEADTQRIRFRAKHRDWIDVIDLYQDGFFHRYHSHDAGIWSISNNELKLKWLQWGDEALRSLDAGKTFGAGGNVSFTLKSYFQPHWWSNQFNANGSQLLQVGTVDAAAVIAKHISGKSATLDEQGYAAVAAIKDNAQMEAFARRVVDSLGMKIMDEGGLQGLVPYYSGVKASQTFAKLVEEVKSVASNGDSWITDERAFRMSHFLPN